MESFILLQVFVLPRDLIRKVCNFSGSCSGAQANAVNVRSQKVICASREKWPSIVFLSSHGSMCSAALASTCGIGGVGRGPAEGDCHVATAEPRNNRPIERGSSACRAERGPSG